VIILGINAYHGDVSAALLRDGHLIAAVEEERFQRIKHVAGFPREAIRCCLRMAGVSGADVDHVAVSRNPRAHLWRKGLFALTHRPHMGLVRERAANYQKVQDLPDTVADALGLSTTGRRPTFHWVEHHAAHLASAFFVSPFDRAAVCAIDGFGDFVSTSWAVGRGSSLEIVRRTYFPHSLGLLYLAITQYLGFNKYGDEFKVMGLAPYGEPRFVDELRRLVSCRPDGQFALDLTYFTHWSGDARMTWEKGEPTIERVFSRKLEDELGPARRLDEPVTSRHEAIAASLQVVFEEMAIHVLTGLQQHTGESRLCLAGGCAMNSVANGKIRERTPFTDVYIQPASGDNGTALGAAFYVWNHLLGQPRDFAMTHGYWGPEFVDSEIATTLETRAADLHAEGCCVQLMADEQALVAWTAGRIAAGDVVGWFQGRMEWGARALGNRSILADPRRADMRSIINTKIKFREKFRPFAPSVLEESYADYFTGAVPDSFMLQVYPIRPDRREIIPDVTHVEGYGLLLILFGV
jgi:carbamoyltransferase